MFVELGNSSINFFSMLFAENYAKKGIAQLTEIFTPGTLRVPTTHNQLQELESVHKVVPYSISLANYSLCKEI